MLHVSPYGPEAWGYGGIPRVVDALAAGLVTREHQVTVATTDARDHLSRLAGQAGNSWLQPHEPQFREDGVELRVFPNLSNRVAYRQQFFLPLGLRRYLDRHLESFQLAHIHGFHHLLGVRAARACRRRGIPYIVAPNGTAPRLKGRRFAKWLFDSTVGSRVLPGASLVLAVSEFEKRQLERLGVASHRIRIVPNPVPQVDPACMKEKGGFRRRWGLGAEPVVLFLGQLMPRKRLDVVVRAFARLNTANARLVVAGEDRGALAEMRRGLKKVGVEKQTVLTGLLAGNDRYRALADADVVVYPSEKEVFGLVALEAILCGTPVVVADDGGCGEVLKQVGGGLTVPVGDSHALAAAMDRILQNGESGRGEARSAQSQVRRLFATEVVVGRLETVYGEVLGMAPPHW